MMIMKHGNEQKTMECQHQTSVLTLARDYKSHKAIRTMVQSGAVTHAKTATLCVPPVHCCRYIVFRCIDHMSVRNVAWHLLEDETFHNMYAVNILVNIFARYLYLHVHVNLESLECVENLYFCFVSYRGFCDSALCKSTFGIHVD